MVTTWLFHILANLLVWVIGLFPAFSLPSWWSSITTGSSTLSGYMGALSSWLPMTAVAIVLGAIAITVPLSAGVKVVRIVISHLTGGGGSAA